ncbi:MAG: hypothetical protein HY943_05255 [Gammaproteobacteria bacterium]|nr:hypothetical protein [Gammaproteobacteria bacterium]
MFKGDAYMDVIAFDVSNVGDFKNAQRLYVYEISNAAAAKVCEVEVRGTTAEASARQE